MNFLKICTTALLIIVSSPSLAKRNPVFDNQTVQMSAQFQVALLADPTAQNADSALLANARRSIYTQALDECAIIISVFPETECRLRNLQINIQRNEKENNAPASLIGNATYIVKEKQ